MGADSLTIDAILSVFLIFVRVGGVVMTAPFFNNSAFPRQVRLYFAMVTTIVLFYVIPGEQAFVSANDGTLAVFIAITAEALVGMAMGMVGQLVFAGFEMAGTLISYNTGLSFAVMVDSSSERQNSIVANILGMIAVLVFLTIGGDKIYITALARSYEIVPAVDHNVHLAGPYMLDIAKYLFVVGVQLTSPFMMAIFLIDVCIAIFARIMPQANLMFISLPIKMGVGIAMFMLVLPYLPTAFDIVFQKLFFFLEGILGEIMPGPVN